MKVLIADDDPLNLKIIRTFLEKWEYEVMVAQDGAEAWNILQQEDAPKLAILDWVMPSMDGLQVCRNVRSRLNGNYVYVILLTAKSQQQEIIDGFEAGADDYLTKPFHANEFRARLRAARRILDLHDQLTRAHEEMKFQASHDPGTGLLNRRAITEVAQAELSRAQRHGTSFSVIMGDVDQFKHLNDTYGHISGDSVLRAVAQELQGAMRGYDTVGRYGGEEFVVIVPGADTVEGAHVAERLRQAVASLGPGSLDGIQSVSMSFGVCGTAQPKAFSVSDLLRRADLALYRAKNAGRNRVEALELESLGEKNSVTIH